VAVAFDIAVKEMREENKKPESSLFLNKLKSDPSLRDLTIDKLYSKIQTQVNAQKELDRLLAK
jgi:hypothetical protein